MDPQEALEELDSVLRKNPDVETAAVVLIMAHVLTSPAAYNTELVEVRWTRVGFDFFKKFTNGYIVTF